MKEEDQASKDAFMFLGFVAFVAAIYLFIKYWDKLGWLLSTIK